MDKDGVTTPVWIGRVLTLVPEGGAEQNLFRSMLFFSLNGLLYDSAPPARSMADVVAEVKERVQTEYPAFEPTFMPELLQAAWPSDPHEARDLGAELLRSAVRSTATREAPEAGTDTLLGEVSTRDDVDENALQGAGVGPGVADLSSLTPTPFSWSPGERRNS
jgi:hypothetical protein